MTKRNQVKFVSGVEKKFDKVKDNLRRVDRRFLKKQDAEDLAYKIHQIESYGFSFHPNVYVWNEVEELNQMTRSLINKQKERNNG